MKYRDGNAKKYTNKILQVGIRDNHNHYTSLRLLFFFDNYRPVDVDLFKACYVWSVLDLHVGDINVLPISYFILLLIIYDPHATQKASVEKIIYLSLVQRRIGWC